jgi:hypothetical protein
MRGSKDLESQSQPGANQSPAFTESRRHPRFKLQKDIRVYSRTAGLLKGYTVDLSEAGISAMLKLELAVGELVQLEFELPYGPVEIRALVRHKTAFCYGFQFVEPDLQGVIKATCSHLAMLQGKADSQ